MDTFFKVILVIFSIGLILTVLLQPGKTSGLSGSIAGGAEQMVGKQKARGIEKLLNRLTIALAVGFMLSAIGVAYFVK